MSNLLTNKSIKTDFILLDSEYTFNIKPSWSGVVDSSEYMSNAADISGVYSIDS